MKLLQQASCDDYWAEIIVHVPVVQLADALFYIFDWGKNVDTWKSFNCSFDSVIANAPATFIFLAD